MSVSLKPFYHINHSAFMYININNSYNKLLNILFKLKKILKQTNNWRNKHLN